MLHPHNQARNLLKGSQKHGLHSCRWPSIRRHHSCIREELTDNGRATSRQAAKTGIWSVNSCITKSTRPTKNSLKAFEDSPDTRCIQVGSLIGICLFPIIFRPTWSKYKVAPVPSRKCIEEQVILSRQVQKSDKISCI